MNPITTYLLRLLLTFALCMLWLSTDAMIGK